MSKRIDFAKQRRQEGRELSRAVRNLAAEIVAVAEQHGIDFQAILDEAAAPHSAERRLLAERLQESVVPLFVRDRSVRPDRIGSCVLVRLDSGFYAFTAAHVIRDAGCATLLAPSEGKGGKLLPLPSCTAHLKFAERNGDPDVGVLVLPARQLGPFRERIFLTAEEIDEHDLPDDRGPNSFYFVLGYPASRTQMKVSKAERRIFQRSFHCATDPVGTAEYLQEKLSQADHLLLDFDHKEIKVEGKPGNPPKLQGVSGGGIFQICRKSNRGPLVAIVTENRRNSRLIVGTRIKHYLTMVRELTSR